jgi:hypothetical protein
MLLLLLECCCAASSPPLLLKQFFPQQSLLNFQRFGQSLGRSVEEAGRQGRHFVQELVAGTL